MGVPFRDAPCVLKMQFDAIQQQLSHAKRNLGRLYKTYTRSDVPVNLCFSYQRDSRISFE
jgi:hypothetical protein